MYNHRTSAALLAVILLAQQQHATAAESACTPPPTGLIAWWPGDGNAKDIAGNHPGTASGAVTYSASRVAQGFTFTSPGSVNFGDIGNFELADFTVALFLKTSSPNAQAILEKRVICDYSDFWSIRITNDPSHAGQVVVELDNQSDPGASGYVLLYSQAPVNDGQFHHIAVTRQGKTAKLYIDGQLNDTKTSVNIIRLHNTAHLVLGSSVCDNVDGTQPFQGQLDEITIFDHAIGAMDIAQIAAASLGQCYPTTIDIKPGQCPNVVTLNGNNVIPVTIYGSALVDVQQLDPATITMGGAGVQKAGNQYQCHVTNDPTFGCPGPIAPPDAYPDLVCHLTTQGAIAIGNRFMILKGTLSTPAGPRGIFGYDSVKVVP